LVVEWKAKVDNSVSPKFKDHDVVVIFVDMVAKNGIA
jgi:hypothetical protein